LEAVLYDQTITMISLFSAPFDTLATIWTKKLDGRYHNFFWESLI
jgi:NO-binding membrane sensor protein with MHYT domain